MPASTMLELIAAILMAVGFPIWDILTMGQLRRNSTHATRMSMYRSIILVEWAVTIAIVLLEVGVRHHATVFLHLEKPLHLPVSQTFVHSMLASFTVALAFGLTLPVVLARRVPAMAMKIHAAFAKLAFMLPAGATERQLFVAVALTAGICEEILYRGFLLHTFSAAGIPLGWAAAIAVVAFGVAHLYQGIAGALASAVAAVLFIGLYVLTGNLIPGIILHALIDLRPLLILPHEGLAPGTSTTAAQEAVS